MKKLLIFIIGLIIISGCVSEEIKQLKSVEVKEYEGKKLDSITDVRDVSIKGPQYFDMNEYRLEVEGLVEEPKSYTYDEVLSFPKYSKVVKLQCVEGWNAEVLWEGVLLKDVIGDVKEEANTVIFYAPDGYSTSLPLDYIRDKDIILAYKINNVTLTPETGYPFILVAEQKFGYKWIKWLTKIEVSNDESYLGYWESRGWDNDADFPE